MANTHHNVLYVGVTNDLERRVAEHKAGMGGKFTAKYQIKKLVYYELSELIEPAIFREKQIKAGSREKKLALLQAMNPEWHDLGSSSSEEIASSLRSSQ